MSTAIVINRRCSAACSGVGFFDKKERVLVAPRERLFLSFSCVIKCRTIFVSHQYLLEYNNIQFEQSEWVRTGLATKRERTNRSNVRLVRRIKCCRRKVMTRVRIIYTYSRVGVTMISR